MSDHEFENYLTLIGRLLRLNTAQREAIGEELRDHFESRLAELTGRGISHTEAVRLCLEEFGDAAGLAAQFTSITQTRNRRIIMRCTVASVAALAAAIVVAISIWPEHRAPQLINQAAAQSNEKPKSDREKSGLDKLVRAAELLPDSHTAETEAKLIDFGEFRFAESPTPLNQVLDYLQSKFDLQFFVDQKSLKAAGIDPTTTMVTLSFEHIRLKLFLEFMFKEYDLGYTVRDGILIVSTTDALKNELETRVYDCRAILLINPFPKAASRESAADGHQAHDAILWSHKPAAAESHELALPMYLVQGTVTSPSENKKPTSARPVESEVAELIDVITKSIARDSWNDVGGNGTIAYYNGLLVVSQTSEVQTKVADLLDQISSKLDARHNPK